MPYVSVAGSEEVGSKAHHLEGNRYIISNNIIIIKLPITLYTYEWFVQPHKASVARKHAKTGLWFAAGETTVFVLCA